MHHRTTQTCHSEERSDVGISGRQLRFRRWLSHDPAGYCEIATSAYGLLAMTNMGASTVLTAAGTDRGGPSRDCHVGLWPPRNDKSGGQQRFNGGRYGSGRAFPRLPRARSALAMTNLEASRHRRNAVLVASLHGAHYPQGARRIRKAAKPPTAAQGTPLQTQSVRAILTIAGSNRQCAAGRGAPSQRKSRGPSGSAKNPGLRFAVPEIFCGFSIRPYRRSRGRP